MRWKTALALLIVPLALALAAWGGLTIYRIGSAADDLNIPTTRVKRGDVTVTVTARGELQGGHSEMLTAPMTGGREMAITYLRKPGEVVKAGDVVVEFDTTEQQFALREAEADVAEAEAQVEQAKSESLAREEEARYALLEAETEVRLAELDSRRNELLAAIVARQNTLALNAANDRLTQIRHDLANRKVTTEAGVAIQEAVLKKAQVKAETARRNIAALTLRAKSGGYVAVQQNNNSNFVFWGMQFPIFQVGDMARAGMAVAQIPDLQSWEVVARMGELDRGHLAVGQAAVIRAIALSGKDFEGSIKNIGGTTGPPWDRRFECKLALSNPSPELRPGMSATIVVTTQKLKDVLWLPSQALFESDGRHLVYLQKDSGFEPQDVKLVRRSESRVVITGLKDSQVVAMANPGQERKKKGAGGGAMQALPKS
ncbi:MAG: HlyD family efflux transporter periplasmic adaptor subunit [Bryobacteraceae bacterium]